MTTPEEWATFYGDRLVTLFAIILNSDSSERDKRHAANTARRMIVHYRRAREQMDAG